MENEYLASLNGQDFCGTWRIVRRIDDRRSGQVGQFEGRAILTEQGPDLLAYSEVGQLRLTADGPSFEATRRYRWRFTGNEVAVSFDDGRPFHRFYSAGAGPGTDHPCGADFYRVQYDFTIWPDWFAVWTVTGPHKDYTMHSAYSRT